MSVDSLALPHTFIHRELSNKAMRLLPKITRKDLERLVHTWVDGSTRSLAPIVPSSQDEDDHEEEQAVDECERAREELKRCSTKEGLILFVNDKWKNGLNLWQIAGLETCFLLQSRHSKYKWTYSTIYRVENQFYYEHIPTVNPHQLLHELEKALFPLVLGHTFVTTYDPLSLVIVRIQIFNPKEKSSSGGPLTGLKPIFLAFPSSSPHVIHSDGEPFYSKAVIVALTNVLSTPTKPVTIKENSAIPVDYLHALAFLKQGASRHAASLGAWSVYADNLVDNSPLDNLNRPKHKTVNNGDAIESKRRKTANLRFTGRDDTTEDYKSKNALSIFEVKLKEKYNNNNTSITIRMEGEDVFAGVHKMVVDGQVDGDKLPDWLTGEETSTSGVVQEGQFTPH